MAKKRLQVNQVEMSRQTRILESAMPAAEMGRSPARDTDDGETCLACLEKNSLASQVQIGSLRRAQKPPGGNYPKREEIMSLPGNRFSRFCWFVVLAIAAVACTRTAPPPPSSARMTANVTYVADSQSRVVHRSDCECVAQISPANRVPFKLLPDALAERYTPCKHCLSNLRASKDRK